MRCPCLDTNTCNRKTFVQPINTKERKGVSSIRDLRDLMDVSNCLARACICSRVVGHRKELLTTLTSFKVRLEIVNTLVSFNWQLQNISSSSSVPLDNVFYLNSGASLSTSYDKSDFLQDSLSDSATISFEGANVRTQRVAQFGNLFVPILNVSPGI